MAFRKAERKKAKLRLGLIGPSGSGKTYSALQMAFGLGGSVAMIDTENGSGDLYAHLGEYDICNLTAPFTPRKYLQAIKEAEDAGYDTIIIDSLSHAWAGEGGLLDIHGAIADKGGNSFAAWRKVTPEHNSLIEAMLQSRCHVIGTMRAKTEYVQDKGQNGNTVIRKVGMAPIQRDGMEYEFTVVLDITAEHTASASKDRTGLFDGQYFKPSPKTGQQLLEWLEQGVVVETPPTAPRMPQDESKPAGAPTTPKPVPVVDLEPFWQKMTTLGLGKDEVLHTVSAMAGRTITDINQAVSGKKSLTQLQQRIEELVTQNKEAAVNE